MPQLFVLLENIRSAYNVGSVFRTCDSAGVNHLYLTGYTAYPPHEKLNKTALGSLESVPWTYCKSPVEQVTLLHETGVEVVAMEVMPQAVSLFEAPFTKDTCLVFGNEVNGVSAEMLELADRIVQIPHFGLKESLNVATAAGVAIYEMVRKRLSMGSTSPTSTS